MSSPQGPGAPAPALPPNAFEDMSGTIIGVVSFLLVWSTLMVGLRVWTRKMIIDQLGWDDYMIMLGLIATYGSAISVTHMTNYGLGKHIYVMNLAHIPLYLKDFYFSICFYCAALLFIKLAFLLGYYRVLAVQNMRIVYIVAIVIVGGWALSQTLVGIFMCTPISGFWDSTIASKCIPNIPQWYINAGGNIATDIAVFCLPLPALWKLQLRKPQKIILISIFCLGFFTVVISVIRIRYLKLFEDFPWENSASSMWSIGELASAITCCCVPSLRPLVGRYFPSLGPTVHGGTTGHKPDGGYGKSHSKYTNSSRVDTEMGKKRGIPLPDAEGSETSFAMPTHKGGAVELSDRVSPFRGSHEGDDRSLASEGSELGLEPKKAGVVGVRTSIRPAKQGMGGAEARGYSGVQVQKELYQSSKVVR